MGKPARLGVNMALITNNISGSSSDSWRIGITGSVRIANPGANDFPAMPGTDVEFFVSGSQGGKGTSGVSVFGGDTVISGTLVVGTGSVTIDSNEIRFLGDVAKITSGSGGLTFADSGGTVTLSDLIAGTAVASYFDSTTADAIFATGSLALVGAEGIDAAADKGADVFFYVSGSNDELSDAVALFGGNLTTSGSFSVKDAAGDFAAYITTAGEISGSSNMQVGGTLAVAGDVSFASKLTVDGDLTVKGTTTSIDTTHLLVKDPVIVLSSGTLGGGSTNRNGGIAIFSGSSSGNDLVFGRVDNDTWGAGTFDTQNGTEPSVASMALSNMRASVFQVGGANKAVKESGTALVVSGTNLVEVSGSSVGVALETTAGSLSVSAGVGGQFMVIASASGGAYPNIAAISSVASNVGIFSNSTDGRVLFGKNKNNLHAMIYSGSLPANPNVAILGSDQNIGTVITGSEVYLAAGGVHVSTVTNSAVLPSQDVTFDLGSPSYRWANIYTGDLHLRNDRGDYTLIEESDTLTIRFNKTGKRYRFVLERAPEFDEEPL